MTRTSNARIAGFVFLFYIAAGITAMVLHRQAMAGADTAKLAAIAQHEPTIRVILLLELAQAFCAIVLGVTLYGLTWVQDRDIAMMGLACRMIEGIIASLTVPQTLALLWLAKTGGDGASDPASARLLAAYLMRGDVAFTATFFAVGSACFAYLLLRGRMIPAALAWTGVVASVLLVVCLPLQLAGILSGPITTYVWMPMLFFEVPLGFWWLIRGDTWTARAQET